MQIHKDEGSTLLTTKDFLIQRNTECELILEEGQYLIVPRTTGCLLRRPEGADVESIRLVDNLGKLNPLFKATLRELFKKLDLLGTKKILVKEFNGFLEAIGKPLIKDD